MFDFTTYINPSDTEPYMDEHEIWQNISKDLTSFANSHKINDRIADVFELII